MLSFYLLDLISTPTIKLKWGEREGR
ncbi:unnamed protein product [Spirodela intermedia]|uniref:Uncharacterized protein n=2 Tax=Spirodela intermedia TaxID=51605 RepID=A0A7I8LD56_SPIIN|nr:unnamed protein product [Spirodela intermedia]CAA6670177.1 unnamed protein product [Spirodela intermedia]CAA7407225.1 unnamed protein product [Spirodela intermedia]